MKTNFAAMQLKDNVSGQWIELTTFWVCTVNNETKLWQFSESTKSNVKTGEKKKKKELENDARDGKAD